MTLEIGKKKINCLVLSETSIGGEWIATSRLISALEKNNNPKYSFAIIPFPNSKRLEKGNFIFELIRDFRYIRNEIDKKLKSEETDLILGTHYLMTLAALSRLFRKERVIHLFHGTKASLIKNFWASNYRQHVIRTLEFLSFNLSDAVTVPSETGKKYLLSRLWFKRNKKVFIVRNIVPDLFFDKSIKTKKKVILYAGRLAKFKGLENLVVGFEKFSRLPTTGFDGVNLTLAFPEVNVFANNLKKRIYELGIKNKVKFVNNPTQKELSKLYTTSEVLILPSELEFAPLSVLEALAAGTLVIGTPVGNIKEVLSKIHRSLILKNNSAEEIVRVLSRFFKLSHNQKKILINKGKKVASLYKEESALKDFQKVINSLG